MRGLLEQPHICLLSDMRWWAPLLPLTETHICTTQFTTHGLSYCSEPIWLLGMSIAPQFLLWASQAQDDDTSSPLLRSNAVEKLQSIDAYT